MTPFVMGLFSFVEAIGTLSAILFIAGLLLLVVEMFIPGFGIAGGTGLVLLIIGIIITARSWTDALIMTLILLAIIALALLVILRSAKKGVLRRRLILWSSARKEQGFSTSDDMANLVGQTGISLTILRPAGFGEFGGRRLDVVAEGSFIEKGIQIRIIHAEGRRIVVEPVQPEDPTGQA
jgi:membrane-bound ClpP family serine protease